MRARPPPSIRGPSPPAASPCAPPWLPAASRTAPGRNTSCGAGGRGDGWLYDGAAALSALSAYAARAAQAVGSARWTERPWPAHRPQARLPFRPAPKPRAKAAPSLLSAHLCGSVAVLYSSMKSLNISFSSLRGIASRSIFLTCRRDDGTASRGAQPCRGLPAGRACTVPCPRQSASGRRRGLGLLQWAGGPGLRLRPERAPHLDGPQLELWSLGVEVGLADDAVLAVLLADGALGQGVCGG